MPHTAMIIRSATPDAAAQAATGPVQAAEQQEDPRMGPRHLFGHVCDLTTEGSRGGTALHAVQQ